MWLPTLAVTATVATIISSTIARILMATAAHLIRLWLWIIIIAIVLIVRGKRFMSSLVVEAYIFCKSVPHVLVLLVSTRYTTIHALIGVMVTSTVTTL